MNTFKISVNPHFFFLFGKSVNSFIVHQRYIINFLLFRNSMFSNKIVVCNAKKVKQIKNFQKTDACLC